MSLGAVSLVGVVQSHIGASGVDLRLHILKMLRPHTVPVSAQVVEGEVIHHTTLIQPLGYTMHQPCREVWACVLPVPLAIDVAGPQPARISAVHVRPEQCIVESH